MNNDKIVWINKPPPIIKIEFQHLQQTYQGSSRSLTQSKYNCEDTHSATTDDKVVMNEK